MVAIMTDTNSGITVAEGKANGFYVLPMPVLVDNRCYMEGVDITHEELYGSLMANCSVHTSQPAPGEVTDMWDRILQEGADEIVYIPMSSELSSSYSTASALAGNYEGKVHVVDNHRISVTQHSSVYDALFLSRQGKTGEEIKKQLEKGAFDASIYICVTTLKYLKRSNRVTAAGASLATAMNLRPVLNIRGGKLDAQCVVRGEKLTQKTLIKLMENDLEKRFRFISPEDVALYTAGSFVHAEDAEAWNERVQKAFPQYQVRYHELSCSIACHVGYDSLAIAMALRER